MKRNNNEIIKYVKEELIKTVDIVDTILTESEIAPPEVIRAKSELIANRRQTLFDLIRTLKVETDIEINKQKLEQDDNEVNVNIKIIGE